MHMASIQYYTLHLFLRSGNTVLFSVPPGFDSTNGLLNKCSPNEHWRPFYKWRKSKAASTFAVGYGWRTYRDLLIPDQVELENTDRFRLTTNFVIPSESDWLMYSLIERQRLIVAHEQLMSEGSSRDIKMDVPKISKTEILARGNSRKGKGRNQKKRHSKLKTTSMENKNEEEKEMKG